MKKREFLAVLQRSLYNLPQNELNEQLNFYSEMIDDRMEEGLSEEEAVSKIGSVSDILSQIGNEKNISSAVSEKEAKKKLSAGMITLLILGSPVWAALLISTAAVFVSVVISLLAAIFAVAVSLCAALWSVWIVICAVEVSFTAVIVSSPFLIFIYLVKGIWSGAAFVFGACLFLAGAAHYLWYGCKHTLFVAIKLTKLMFFVTVNIIKFSYLKAILFFKSWRKLI